MTAAELVAGVAARGGQLTVCGGRLRYRGPAHLLTPRLRAAIAAQRPALLALLSNRENCLRAFAASGRLLRVDSAVLCAPVYLAADTADTSSIPADAVILWPDELRAVLAGDVDLALLHEAKRHFDPHGRTLPDPDAPALSLFGLPE